MFVSSGWGGGFKVSPFFREVVALQDDIIEELDFKPYSASRLNIMFKGWPLVESEAEAVKWYFVLRCFFQWKLTMSSKKGNFEHSPRKTGRAKKKEV